MLTLEIIMSLFGTALPLSVTVSALTNNAFRENFMTTFLKMVGVSLTDW
jgi:hypothetical protein